MELFHVLNRGVDKRQIFMDEEDRFRFIHDLFEFNDTNPAGLIYYNFRKSPSQSLDVGRPEIGTSRELLVHIHSFTMMNNHYHLLLSPVVENGIPLFMKKLGGGYTKYFNEKHKRSGALFQGKYKKVHINNERHFTYIPYYIHFNPLDFHAPEWRERNIPDTRSASHFLKSYRWSSHLDYLGEKNFPSVTHRNFLLNYFGGTSGYRNSFEHELLNFSIEELGKTTLE
jgi:putative transposase